MFIPQSMAYVLVLPPQKKKTLRETWRYEYWSGKPSINHPQFLPQGVVETIHNWRIFEFDSGHTHCGKYMSNHANIPYWIANIAILFHWNCHKLLGKSHMLGFKKWTKSPQVWWLQPHSCHSWMVNHVKSPPIPQKMSLPTHLPGTFQTSPSGRHCWDASARPPGAIKLPFGDGWNMLEYPPIQIIKKIHFGDGLLLGLPHLSSRPSNFTLQYHTIPVHHSLQGKRNVHKQWADSLKQTSASNAWNFSQLETKRPFPGSCAFKGRRCDKPMVSPCWMADHPETLRAANLPAAPKWLGPVLRVKSRRLRWCCPPSWSSLSSCLRVRRFEAHLENKWNNQWGPWSSWNCQLNAHPEGVESIRCPNMPRLSSTWAQVVKRSVKCNFVVTCLCMSMQYTKLGKLVRALAFRPQALGCRGICHPLS